LTLIGLVGLAGMVAPPGCADESAETYPDSHCVPHCEDDFNYIACVDGQAKHVSCDGHCDDDGCYKTCKTAAEGDDGLDGTEATCSGICSNAVVTSCGTGGGGGAGAGGPGGTGAAGGAGAAGGTGGGGAMGGAGGTGGVGGAGTGGGPQGCIVGTASNCF